MKYRSSFQGLLTTWRPIVAYRPKDKSLLLILKFIYSWKLAGPSWKINTQMLNFTLRTGFFTVAAKTPFSKTWKSRWRTKDAKCSKKSSVFPLLNPLKLHPSTIFSKTNFRPNNTATSNCSKPSTTVSTSESMSSSSLSKLSVVVIHCWFLSSIDILISSSSLWTILGPTTWALKGMKSMWMIK